MKYQIFFKKAAKMAYFTFTFLREMSFIMEGGCNSNKDDRQTAQVSCLILCRYTKFQTFFAKAAKMAHFTLTFSRKKFPYYRGACSSNTDDRQNAQVKSHILCNYMIFQTFFTKSAMITRFCPQIRRKISPLMKELIMP